MLLCKRCSCQKDQVASNLNLVDTSILENIFSALASNQRLRILLLLSIQPHCVCDLEAHTSISQSLLSQYLAILENTGLVEKKRDGKFTEFSMTSKGLVLIKKVKEILMECSPETNSKDVLAKQCSCGGKC